MLAANGSRYNFVSVTRRSIRAGSRYPAPAGPEICHGARRVRHGFCRLDTNFAEHYACRGTSLIGARKLSTVQDFNCEQMRVSGCKNHYEFVLGAVTKKKP